MYAKPYFTLLILSLFLGFCVGCANTGKKLGKVGKVFSPVTGLVRGTTNAVKNVGSGMAEDTRRYSTKLPGASHTTLTASERRAIAQYERKKQYENYRRKHDMDSNLIPKGAKVYVNK